MDFIVDNKVVPELGTTFWLIEDGGTGERFMGYTSLSEDMVFPVYHTLLLLEQLVYKKVRIIGRYPGISGVIRDPLIASKVAELQNEGFEIDIVPMGKQSVPKLAKLYHELRNERLAGMKVHFSSSNSKLHFSSLDLNEAENRRVIEAKRVRNINNLKEDREHHFKKIKSQIADIRERNIGSVMVKEKRYRQLRDYVERFIECDNALEEMMIKDKFSSEQMKF
ncbi:hypothetical protein [Mesobacillus selenatarsenatis]|nr:hypothetical protein [Mesobacillus selenatarsenatis]